MRVSGVPWGRTVMTDAWVEGLVRRFKLRAMTERVAAEGMGGVVVGTAYWALI
jgi:hypothetical protein